MNITHKEIILELEENFKKLVETFKINDNNAKDIILKNIELLKGNVTKKNDISIYSEAVQHMALTNMDNEFPYKGLDHSLSVYNRFIQHSKNNIPLNIFNEDLNNEIFNNEEFLFYLEVHLKSKPLNLLIRKIEGNESKALALILKYSKDRKEVTVKQSSDQMIEDIKREFISNTAYNFIISGTGFILETEPENLKGVCNFKDMDITKRLGKFFNEKDKNIKNKLSDFFNLKF